MQYFVADTHFGDAGKLTRSFGQPFDDPTERDRWLLDEINATVGRDDVLWILGDFANAKPGKYRQAIRCRQVFLILGNHDPEAKCRNCFSRVEHVHDARLKGRDGEKRRCWLSHYPHAYWPASHHGSLHLYGHTHTQAEAPLDAGFPGRRSMDVGIDNLFRLLGAYRPISELEILDSLLVLLDRTGHESLAAYEAADRTRRAGAGANRGGKAARRAWLDWRLAELHVKPADVKSVAGDAFVPDRGFRGEIEAEAAEDSEGTGEGATVETAAAEPEASPVRMNAWIRGRINGERFLAGMEMATGRSLRPLVPLDLNDPAFPTISRWVEDRVVIERRRAEARAAMDACEESRFWAEAGFDYDGGPLSHGDGPAPAVEQASPSALRGHDGLPPAAPVPSP